MESLQQIRKKALQAAHQLREEYDRQGDEFTQQGYRDALAPKLKTFAAAAYDAFVDDIAEVVDRHYSRREETEQPTLFDLGGEYRLGKGRRRPKWAARFQDAEESLMLDDQNLMAVQAANLRKRKELNDLRPYWGPGITKEQAVAAYDADHPEEDDS